MVGNQPTGRIAGVEISTVIHEGITVLANGKPCRLAVIDDEGHIIAEGKDVASEVRAVAVNGYRAFLQGKGHMRVYGDKIPNA